MTVVIANPAAGGGRCGRLLDQWLPRLGEVELRTTTGPGDAVDMAREVDAERVIAVGGDGTLHEVVNGLLQRSDRPALGVLPLGTGNSFLRDFGLHEAEAALDALLRDERRPVDVLKIEHAEGTLHSINLVSLGFVAEVGDLTNRRFKFLGPLGYVVSTMITVARLDSPSIPVTIDGSRDERPGVFLCFCNSQFTGGSMQMAPAADPGDGQLDVIRVGQMGRRRLLRLFPKIFEGTHVDATEIEASRTTRVDLHLDGPIPALIDGESAHLRIRSVEVVPAALELIA